VELLRAEEPSECDGADEEARKVEALKELNDMVTTLQEGGVFFLRKRESFIKSTVHYKLECKHPQGGGVRHPTLI
jgi:hypothetical protein